MNKSLLLITIIFGAWTGLLAQSVPTPGTAQQEAIFLTNGTIHIGTGEVIANGSVLFRDGKIVEVGASLTAPGDARTIDLNGQHVYPGLIAAGTNLGLHEIGAVRATDDTREVGAINPNARALVSYNSDSRVIPTVRSNGVLLAQIAPTGGLISGTSSIVQLDAWNWEDASYRPNGAVFMNWPRMRVREAWWADPVEKQKKQIKENIARIDKMMMEAKAYRTLKESEQPYDIDLRWEAMVPVLDKRVPLIIRAESEQQIRAALAFALQHDIRMILCGGADAWRVTDDLKQYDIPVILTQTQALPRHDESDIDQPFKTPALLRDAGVQYCISENGFWQQRNLAFQAGQAVGFGLTKEEALTAVTLDVAKILGIADRTGSLEAGKDANIVISKGDLLDYRTSVVTQAYVQGRDMDLGNKQKDLYRKFSGKYDLEVK